MSSKRRRGYLWKSKQIGRVMEDDDAAPDLDTIDLSHIPRKVHADFENQLAALMKHHKNGDMDINVIFSTMLTFAAIAVCGLPKKHAEDGRFLMHLAEKEARVVAPDFKVAGLNKFEMTVMALCGNIFLKMDLDIDDERIHERLYWACSETAAFFWRKWDVHQP